MVVAWKLIQVMVDHCNKNEDVFRHIQPTISQIE